MFSITLEMVVHIYTAWSQQMPIFSITLEKLVCVCYTAWSQQMPVCSPTPWKWSYMSTHCLVTTNAYVLHHPRNNHRYLHCLVTTNAYVLHQPRNGQTYQHCLVTTNGYVLHHHGNGCTCLHSARSQQMPMFSITLEMVVHVYTVPGHNKCLCSPSPWKWLYMSTQCQVTTNAYVIHHPGNGCTCLHSARSQQMPVCSPSP